MGFTERIMTSLSCAVTSRSKPAKHLFIILSFFVSGFLNAQDLRSGLILPGQSFDVCCVYIPSSGLVVYDRPNGSPVGKLTLGPADNNDEMYEAFILANGETREFEHLTSVGYEEMAVVFSDRQNHFLKIDENSWINSDELESNNLIPTNWMDYLINTQEILGWYANEPGLNLRAEPTTTSEILATMKGDLWTITPTKETNGLWSKVTVEEYSEHPCFGIDEKVTTTLIGWVKLLSDDHTPNVWNYSKGC